MKSVGDALKYLLKAYVGGCVGCLGALSAAAVVALVVAIALGPQLGSMLQQVPTILAPVSSGLGSLPSGPPGAPGTATTAPAPTGILPSLEIWLTKEDRPDAPPVTALKAGETTRYYLWARGPRGAAVSFDLWMTAPDGNRERFGPAGVFRADPGGNPVSCGQCGTPPTTGTYRLEAVIGTTSVASTTFVVQ